MTMQNIPKIIHYIWLGGNDKPKEVKKYIEGWKQILNDYEFIEWNEDNFNVEFCEYTKIAYENKKYAYVSDVIRICALKQYGGIYLDTDVEVIKKFDDLLSDCSGFFCFESNEWLATAVIGALPNQLWEVELLDLYKKMKFQTDAKDSELITNVKIITNYLEEKVDLLKNGSEQKLKNNIKIYPQEFFSPIDMSDGILRKSSNTVCIHHFKGTWVTKSALLHKKIYRKVVRIVGKKNAEKIYNFLKGCDDHEKRK